MKLKVTVVGGGSSYMPELINGFLARHETFPVTDLWLMDIWAERLDIVGGFAQRMVAAKGSPFAVHLTTDRREAVRDADYVITQFRVGRMQARCADEYLGKRHGLIGQETTGVGGMAKALRTVPVVLDIANDMRELAANALLVNFTNPSGLVMQALADHAPDVPSVGVCNVPIIAKMDLLEKLEERQGQHVDPDRAVLDTLGLNHLSWHRGLDVDGEDAWPQAFESYLAHLREAEEPEWDARTVEILGMLPSYYLQYYYHTDRVLLKQEVWPPSRAEEVMEIEKALLAQYSEPDRSEPPEDLEKRGGAYYSAVATQLLNAHYNDLSEPHIVNVPNGDAVSGWPAEWVLELPCKVGNAGITPIPTEPLPLACYGLLAQVKAYELLTVEAAVRGDRGVAYQALLAHPLGPAAGEVQAVLDDLLETNRDHLPQFWAS